MGASAGSIAATMMAARIAFDDIAELFIDLAEEHSVWERDNGLVGEWGYFLQLFLERILPHELSPEVLSRINILVTPANLMKGPQLVSNFASKKDLIEAILASTHIPFFMDGKPWREFRNENFIDGSFWSLLANIKGPWPVDDLNYEEDVFHVNQNHDVRFIEQLESKAILRMVDAEMMYEMMESGYEYMELQAHSGNLPIRTHSYSYGTFFFLTEPVLRYYCVETDPVLATHSTILHPSAVELLLMVMPTPAPLTPAPSASSSATPLLEQAQHRINLFSKLGDAVRSLARAVSGVSQHLLNAVCAAMQQLMRIFKTMLPLDLIHRPLSLTVLPIISSPASIKFN